MTGYLKEIGSVISHFYLLLNLQEMTCLRQKKSLDIRISVSLIVSGFSISIDSSIPV